MRTFALVGALIALGSFTAQTASATPDWAGFRGPGSRGVGSGERLPDTWSSTENVVWKVAIPGRGWSSPIVTGGRVFLTSAVSGGEVELPKKGLYFGGNRSEPSPHEHEWTVLCLNVGDGTEIWKRVARRGEPETALHLKNTYASETPVTDGERIYAYFGNVGLFAYDLEGELLWTRRWDPVPTRYGWGTAASPALHGDRIYIVNDNEEQSFLVALDKTTGEVIWRVERDEGSNWSTPFVWENRLRTEIVTPGSDRTRAYDLEGNLLWELSGMSSITIATPFAEAGLLYLSSGFVMDRNRPLFAVRPGASGDITPSPEKTTGKFVAWMEPTAAPYNPSPLLYEGRLYVLFDRGFFTCHDARTGEPVYGKQRITTGTSGFTASPWAYDGKVFCLSEDGDTFVIQAGPEYRLLRTNPLDELCMATPAIAADSLFIRTFGHLYRIARPESSTNPPSKNEDEGGSR